MNSKTSIFPELLLEGDEVGKTVKKARKKKRSRQVQRLL